jgi:ribokinase
MPFAPVKFAVVGGLREDTCITPRGDVHLRKLGGNAVYAAVGARLWSERVGLVARVGSNYPLEWLDIIAAHGIDTAGVTIAPHPLDTRTFYAYLTPEERDDTNPQAHFARLGQPLPPDLIGYATSTAGQEDRNNLSPLGVRAEDIPPTYRAADAFHLSPFDFGVHYHLPPWLRRQGIRSLTADPSVRYMQPRFAADVRHMLQSLDAFLPSEMETRGFFAEPLDDLWTAAEAFGALGARIVVLKLGARGQYVYETAGARRWHVPAYPAAVVDVTGAGDAYCGGFMVGLAETGDPLEAALRGSVSASLVIEGFGALYALETGPALAPRRVEELRHAVLPVS